ncbi:alpha/beta fold hydrolase [Flexivirga sp. ID2601S]|uniref:Alpha/beta fold hydrolase n=1 Tax=Flexivirga aerilata TaxID=1656889 RepID=A0A849ACY2_9MICO|nr:alpha/beta fold hydrolase [Flexivirga aerilata]NNG38329.1 alpha/beta fold hydrolase [Flexivirga aerilata]
MIELAFTRISAVGDSGRLLVVGPSLGTSVRALWSAVAGLLDDVEVVGWDLPGHGGGPVSAQAFTIEDLAAAVSSYAGSSAAGRTVYYAGVSLGGAVGLQLALAGQPFAAIGVFASDLRIGQPAGWFERAALVRADGTAAVVAGSRERWFAPGFVDRAPGPADQLLADLPEIDRDSYAFACEALAGHDLTAAAAGGFATPTLLVAGEADEVVTPAAVRATAELTRAPHLVLSGVGHQAPVEAPERTATAIQHLMEDPS